MATPTSTTHPNPGPSQRWYPAARLEEAAAAFWSPVRDAELEGREADPEALAPVDALPLADEVE